MTLEGHSFIIADTSCLILFERIDSFDLLNELYGNIILPPEVALEYGKHLPKWISVQEVKDIDKKLEMNKMVDLGEACAIALAIEIRNCILIIDDKRGRALARKLNIEITGTLGTLLKAKKAGLIPVLKPFVEKLKAVNYRMSKEIEEDILREAGEYESL